MPSPVPNSGSPEDRGTNSAEPTKIETKEIQLYPTVVKLQIPTNIFEASAWGNIAINHFNYDTTACELIHRAESQLPALTELGEHFYEVINRSTYQLNNINDKEWLRFLAAGPNTLLTNTSNQDTVNPVDVAYANILFSASCLCKADAVQDHSSNIYQRWREAGFVTCAHAIIQLHESVRFDSIVGPMPVVQLKEKLLALESEHPGRSLRLERAVDELIQSFDTSTDHLANIIKEHGTIGDKIFSLSSETVTKNFEITRQNHQIFGTLQDQIRAQTTRDSWINADDHLPKLVNAEGGHLSCFPDAIFRSEHLRKAAIGMICEINKQADQIILMGTRWVDPLVKSDLQKRSAQDLVNLIHYWLEDTDPNITLKSLMNLTAESELLNGVYTFFKHLKNSHANSRASLQLNINPDLTNHFDKEKVVIIGDNEWTSFFHNNKYVSIYLTNTSAENKLDFSRPISENSGVSYVKAAVYNVANEPDRGCGAWKSCYVSGPGLHQVISSVKWENFTEQFHHFTRTGSIQKDQPHSDRLHNHYVFIHHHEPERKRVARMQPKNRFVNT